jgi:hypothetical protein
MYNGRALISLERTKGELVVSVVSKGLPAVFLKVA